MCRNPTCLQSNFLRTRYGYGLRSDIPRSVEDSVSQYCNIQVFHSLYKVGRNGNFVFKGFNNIKKKLSPVGLDLVQEIIAGLGVQ